MLDANGAFTSRRALAAAHETYTDFAVGWLEEPVPSYDVDGLRRVRDAPPDTLPIADGFSCARPRSSG